jgi:hypothetical protein
LTLIGEAVSTHIEAAVIGTFILVTLVTVIALLNTGVDQLITASR